MYWFAIPTLFLHDFFTHDVPNCRSVAMPHHKLFDNTTKLDDNKGDDEDEDGGSGNSSDGDTNNTNDNCSNANTKHV